MKIHTVPSLAEPVGSKWKSLQDQYNKDTAFHIASPLSSTPLPIYQWVVTNAQTFTNWGNVRFILMDEMLSDNHPPFSYTSLEDSASYESFANRNFLTPLQQKIGISVPVMKPNLQKIHEFVPTIDLLILAMGIGGNYANVMSGTPLDTGWHIADLTPEYRESHTKSTSMSYADASFGRYGMSLGHQQVLAAKNICIIISGTHKRQLTEQLLSYSDFNAEFPLSIIFHPRARERVEIFITEDVLS